MPKIAQPAPSGQATDPGERRTRADALKLSPQEAHAVRVATRRIAAARGGFVALSVAIGVSTNTLYHAANPKRRPSLAFAVRLAAAAKVPVEVLLGGRVVVAPAIIGRAA